MPTEPNKPLILISYAHADEPEQPAEGEAKWLSFVTSYLRPAIKHGAVDLWLDRLMPGGAESEPEIERKLRDCDIFILLVSPNSLASDSSSTRRSRSSASGRRRARPFISIRCC